MIPCSGFDNLNDGRDDLFFLHPILEQNLIDFGLNHHKITLFCKDFPRSPRAPYLLQIWMLIAMESEILTESSSKTGNPELKVASKLSACLTSGEDISSCRSVKPTSK